MTRILCEAGAEIDLRDKDGERPTQLGEWCGRQLCKLGISFNCEGVSPSKVKRVVAPLLPWSTGYTPLHMASGYLHTPVVELLLAYGADPEVLRMRSECARHRHALM